MAVIKYSALVDQLRGNLNGTVFSRFHAGFNAYKKGQPKRWGSSHQQLIRQSLQQAAQRWNTMPSIYRANWNFVAANTTYPNRLGDNVHLSGFAAFVKFWQLRAVTVGVGDGWVDQSLASPGGVSLEAYDLTVDQVGGSYRITNLYIALRVTESPQAAAFVPIMIGNPVANEDSNYDNTFYVAGWVYVDPFTPVNTVVGHLVTDYVMPLSWHTYDAAWHHVSVRPATYDTGRQGLESKTVVQSSYTPPAPPVWEVDWTFPSNSARFSELVNSGGTWIAGGTGSWYAGTNELLPGVAGDYQVEIAMSPNKFGSDIPRPEEFTVPRPTYSGVLVNKVDTPPYYLTPISLANLQTFMNSNFSYSGMDEYLYQPMAIRLRRPSDGTWSSWGYSNIWLPIF